MDIFELDGLLERHRFNQLLRHNGGIPKRIPVKNYIKDFINDTEQETEQDPEQEEVEDV